MNLEDVLRQAKANSRGGADARTQWRELGERIAAFDAEFAAFAKENEDARQLTTIPGIGVLIASALLAAIGKAETFDHGRDLAAWLGFVPRQATTGGKPKLLGISKRGNRYLRRQLIHGARGAAPCRQARYAARAMADGAARPRSSERRGRRLRRQGGDADGVRLVVPRM